MLIAAEICPGLIKLEGFIKSDPRQVCGNGPDTISGNAAAFGNIFRRIFIRQITLGQMLEYRAMPFVSGGQIWRDAFGIKSHRFLGFAVNNQKLAISAAQQHAFVWPLSAVHQCRRIGQLREIIQIHFASFEQQMHHGEDKQSICAGCNADPFVGNRIVTCADRIDANHLRTTFLQPPQTHFDRVAVVIFGHAEEHEQFCALPIRLSELPKSTAHGVNAPSGHIHRAKAAMGCIVWRAKPLRPK